MSDDVKNAVAEAAKEIGVSEPVSETPAAPETTEAAPVEEAAKEAEPTPGPETDKPAPVVEEDDLFRLSKEELDEIDKDPRLKKAYKSMVRDYRDKTAKVAELRRTLGDRGKLVDAIAEDPDMAVRALAAIRGIKLTEPEKPAAVKSELDQAREKLEASLGKEGADLLMPLIEGSVKNLVEQRVAPLEKAAAAYQQSALAQTINSGLAAFKSEVQERGEDWSDEIEEEMAGLVDKFSPGPKTTLPEYLSILHSKVVHDKNKIKSVKSQIDRIKDASASREPVRGVRPAAEGPKSITASMSQADSIKLAVEMAKAQLSGR